MSKYDVKIKYSITFTTITPESAEHGDFADTGFEVEDDTDTLRDLLDIAENHGIVQNSTNDLTEWFSSNYVITDYSTGEEKQYCLHIKDISHRNRVAKYLRSI